MLVTRLHSGFHSGLSRWLLHVFKLSNHWRPLVRRVDALQSYVAGLTGIVVGDQILMCEGVPLDPAKPLSAYKLPLVRAGHRRPSLCTYPEQIRRLSRRIARTSSADMQRRHGSRCCRVVLGVASLLQGCICRVEICSG